MTSVRRPSGLGVPPSKKQTWSESSDTSGAHHGLGSAVHALAAVVDRTEKPTTPSLFATVQRIRSVYHTRSLAHLRRCCRGCREHRRGALCRETVRPVPWLLGRVP